MKLHMQHLDRSLAYLISLLSFLQGMKGSPGDPGVEGPPGRKVCLCMHFNVTNTPKQETVV